MRHLYGHSARPLAGSTAKAVETQELPILRRLIWSGTSKRPRQSNTPPTTANVANASSGAGGTDAVVANAIAYAAGKNMAFVAAAGNSAVDTDVTPFWPADSSEPNEISVGASQSDGTVASFSNYGLATVGLFAPGVNIYTTPPNHQYGYLSGTSLSTPFVTGTVALLEGLHPTWTYTQIINQIETTATELPTMAGQSVTGGLLNAAAAVAPVYQASASFAGTDTTTQGNWETSYGSSGFDVSQDPSPNNPSLPSYATLNITGALYYAGSIISGSRALLEAAPGTAPTGRRPRGTRRPLCRSISRSATVKVIAWRSTYSTGTALGVAGASGST